MNAKISISTKALKKAEARLCVVDSSISSIVEEFAAHAAGKFTAASFLHATGHEDPAPVIMGKELSSLLAEKESLVPEIQAAKAFWDDRPCRVEEGWVWVDGLALILLFREWKHYMGGPSSMSYVMCYEWHTPHGVIVVS
mgnify:CR=1 FL=1